MSDAVAAAEDGWRRVHPASIVVNLVPRAWGLVRSAWPLLLALLWGGASREGIANLVVLGGFFATALASSLVHTLTLRYRVAQGRLEIRTGLLSRQARSIALDRIQNVVVVRNVFHRLSGLCELSVETASGREVEGLLSAIDAAEAERLMAALSSRSPASAPDDEGELLVANGPVDLVWAGLADLRLGAVAVVLGLLAEWIPQGGEDAARLAERFSGAAGTALVVALISGAWLFGIGTSVVRKFGFRLVRTSRGLVAEQGLFTRRRTELRPAKVQLVTWLEPVVLRAVGLGSVQIETAAAREAGSGTEKAEAVVPVVDAHGARAVLGSALAAPALDGPASRPADLDRSSASRAADLDRSSASRPADFDPAGLPLLPAHPRAFVRASVGASLRLLLGAALGWLVLGWAAGAVAVALWPLALLSARWDVRSQGYGLFGRLLVSRRGYLTRKTTVLDRTKVQSASLVQTPFMRRREVGLLVVRVAGSRVVLPLLGVDEARRLQDLLIGPAALEVGHSR